MLHWIILFFSSLTHSVISHNVVQDPRFHSSTNYQKFNTTKGLWSEKARYPGFCSGNQMFDCYQHFRCNNTKPGGVCTLNVTCVDISKVRNGVNHDCPDGSDEWCGYEELACPRLFWKCIARERYFEDCDHRAKESLCNRSDALPCRHSNECGLKDWARGSGSNCLDNSPDDCGYIARYLTATEMRQKYCAAWYGSKDPVIPSFLPDGKSSTKWWACFNTTVNSAKDYLNGSLFCNCPPGQMENPDSKKCEDVITKTFEFRGLDICGYMNFYAEGLKDTTSPYYENVATIMFESAFKLSEASSVTPMSHICFPKTEMKNGSEGVLFGIRVNCSAFEKYCNPDDIISFLRQVGSNKLDVNYVKDISYIRANCSECDINSDCRPYDGGFICSCREGFYDLAKYPEVAGEKCMRIHENTTMPSENMTTDSGYETNFTGYWTTESPDLLNGTDDTIESKLEAINQDFLNSMSEKTGNYMNDIWETVQTEVSKAFFTAVETMMRTWVESLSPASSVSKPKDRVGPPGMGSFGNRGSGRKNKGRKTGTAPSRINFARINREKSNKRKPYGINRNF